MKASQFNQGKPKPAAPARPEHPLHDFFKPKTFAKNFVAGVGVILAWNLIKGSHGSNPVSEAVRENT